MSRPARVSRQTVMPFTPALANLAAEVSIAHGLVVIVWMQSRLRTGSGEEGDMRFYTKEAKGGEFLQEVREGTEWIALRSLRPSVTRCFSGLQAAEEGVVFFSLDDPLEVERGLAEVVVAPKT